MERLGREKAQEQARGLDQEVLSVYANLLYWVRLLRNLKRKEFKAVYGKLQKGKDNMAINLEELQKKARMKKNQTFSDEELAWRLTMDHFVLNCDEDDKVRIDLPYEQYRIKFHEEDENSDNVDDGHGEDENNSTDTDDAYLEEVAEVVDAIQKRIKKGRFDIENWYASIYAN